MTTRTPFLQILTFALAFGPSAAYPVTPWQQGTLSGAVPPTIRIFRSVAGGHAPTGSNYVAALVGDACTTRRSLDGIDWRTYSEPEELCALNDLVWNGSEYVGVGYTQLDGVNFGKIATTTNPATFGYFTVVGFPNTMFHAVTPMPEGNYLVAGHSLIADELTIRVWRLTNTGAPLAMPVTLPTPHQIGSLIWDGVRYMAVDHGGNLLASSDGTSWNSSPIGSSSLYGIAVGTIAGTRTHVAVGNNGTIATSVNEGSSWNIYHHPSSAGFYGVAWNGERFVVVGTLCGVLSSRDGFTWVTEVSELPCATMIDVTWLSAMKRWVAVGTSGAVLHNDSIFTSHFQN